MTRDDLSYDEPTIHYQVAAGPMVMESGNRVDVRVEAGQALLVLLEGLSEQSTFRLNLTNLVGLIDGVLFVFGTPADDRIEIGFTADDPRPISINDTDYEPSHFDGVIPNAIRIAAGAGNDTVLVHPQVSLPSWINGQSAHDTLYGRGGDDRLLGGAGHDRLVGRSGRDRLRGQAGNDWLNGQAGHDTLWGSAGDDILFGGAGRDVMTGGTGLDSLNGQGGNDRWHGRDSSDRLRSMEWHSAEPTVKRQPTLATSTESTTVDGLFEHMDEWAD